MIENGAESLKMARQTSLIIVAPVRPALQDRCECSAGRQSTFKKTDKPQLKIHALQWCWPSELVANAKSQVLP
jgi:hypothetical protein